MEKWVPCQKDTRKRKAGPHKFSDTAFRAPLPLPVTSQGAYNTFTHEPERVGTKKPKQVPPPETVERGNAETLAWVPYPSPLPPPPSASSSSNWQSEALACKKNNKNRSYCTYTRAPCASKFVISLSNVCTDATEGIGYCAYLGTRPKNSHKAIIVTGR